MGVTAGSTIESPSARNGPITPESEAETAEVTPRMGIDAVVTVSAPATRI